MDSGWSSWMRHEMLGAKEKDASAPDHAALLHCLEDCLLDFWLPSSAEHPENAFSSDDAASSLAQPARSFNDFEERVYDDAFVCPADVELKPIPSFEVHTRPASLASLATAGSSKAPPSVEHNYFPYGSGLENHPDGQNSAEVKGHASGASSRHAQKRIMPIKAWLQDHASSPYASEGDLEDLAATTGLSSRQVRVCLNNLRARMKFTENPPDALNLSGIPYASEGHQTNLECEQLSTMHFNDWLARYGLAEISGEESFNTMPQTVGVDLSTPTINPFSGDPSNLYPLELTSTTTSPHALTILTTKAKRKGKRCYRSRYSADTGQSSSPSASDDSNGHTQADKKPYHCTLCVQSFKDAYGWKRHEAGVHGFHVQEWICMLDGILLDGNLCAFCGEEADNWDHFNEHNHSLCFNKEQTQRTFARKDLFKQHIQQVHLPNADDGAKKAFEVPDFWVREVDASRSDPASLWCGFCRDFLPSTAIRMDHVADHFRDGRDMSTWQRHSASHYSLGVYTGS